MTSTMSRESSVRDGILTGPRIPAARLRQGDLITGDQIALAGDLQYAWRIVRAPRGAWIVAEPVARDLGASIVRAPFTWKATGPAAAHRVPRGGVFVLPQEEEDTGSTTRVRNSLWPARGSRP